MFVVIGANGQTGSVVAKTLLQANKPVRVVLRRPEQAAQWTALGAQVAIADVTDKAALQVAFNGATAAYLMNPPAYQAEDMFVAAQNVHRALIEAAVAMGVGHVVALSSVGGQHVAGTGNILTTHDLEQQLKASPLRYTILRAANFIENWTSAISPAREKGILPSMFHPLDKALPMVSAVDIGLTAAALMMDFKAGIVELHGPKDYSPNDAAAALSILLGHPVQAVEAPRAAWSGIFTNIGFNPVTANAFCAMFDGFNTNHIVFENTHTTLRGQTSLEDALKACLDKPAHH